MQSDDRHGRNDGAGGDRRAEGLRARKKRQTRAAIAAAAMDLFQARGFDAVTIADIAAAADVSRKTIFNYFPAKEDLVFVAGRRAPRGARPGHPRAPAGNLARRSLPRGDAGLPRPRRA